MSELFIDGPNGRLEACYSESESATGMSAVLCHPHPQFGGSMNDMVLGAVEPALLAAGVNCLRFNFRGVGASDGSYGEGVGEVEDATAAASWVQKQSPGGKLVLVGYSFGGAVALSAQDQISPDCMILVAPAVGMFGESEPPGCSTLVILAGNDQFVDANSTRDWFGTTDAQVVEIPETDHFFFGHHNQVTEIVNEFLGEQQWN